MGIKEILEAKRLKALGGAADAPVKEQVAEAQIAKVEKLEAAQAAPVTAVAEPVKQEPATLPGKPLSFAEKMAARKAAEQAGVIGTPATIPTPVTTVAATAVSQPSVEAGSNTSVEVAKVAGPLDHLSARIAQAHVALPAETMSREDRMKQIAADIPEGTESAVADAYIDIKLRIDDLVTLSGEDLVGAMTELKKALMKNPSAVSLMLDPDIGQMVIALRRITSVASAESAVKTSKTGPKASKSVQLTAEALELAFASI